MAEPTRGVCLLFASSCAACSSACRSSTGVRLGFRVFFTESRPSWGRRRIAQVSRDRELRVKALMVNGLRVTLHGESKGSRFMEVSMTLASEYYLVDSLRAHAPPVLHGIVVLEESVRASWAPHRITVPPPGRRGFTRLDGLELHVKAGGLAHGRRVISHGESRGSRCTNTNLRWTWTSLSSRSVRHWAAR